MWDYDIREVEARERERERECEYDDEEEEKMNTAAKVMKLILIVHDKRFLPF
jgi:hypothetical protein